MNRVAILTATLLLAPASAQGHGDQFAAVDESMNGWWPTPTVSEVEDAIEAAAVEFGVPEGILQGIAHTESRWQHNPYRVSQDGRRGLFQMTDERLDLAAALLDLDEEVVMGSVTQHARGFAALLNEERPWMMGNASEITVGAWRPAIGWAMELPESFRDQYVDMLFETIAAGVIEQLPTGEPITIAPWPIDAAYLGYFAPSEHRNPDYGSAIWNPTSCNYTNASRSGGDVDTVVIHTIQGSYSGAISWFHNCSAQVSAHYVVSTTGSITQVVDEADIGWHVSCWNGFTIGIEHEGYAEEPELWYTDAMYVASAALVADIIADWGIPADRDHIIEHAEVASSCNTNGHWDPGPGWDWDYYMDLIGGSSVPPDTTELVGYIRHTDLYESDYGISGATVSIDGVGSVPTNVDGFYSFDDIAPGIYDICATAFGYEEGCRNKTVEGNVTNWGSILLEPDAGDDDDDATTDDDDATDDDDDATDDDDDDDDATDDDDDATDDDDDDDPVVDSARRSYTSRRGCSASIGGGDAPATAALLLLLGAGLVRRRAIR